jgi:molecular chaperone GrpE
MNGMTHKDKKKEAETQDTNVKYEEEKKSIGNAETKVVKDSTEESKVEKEELKLLECEEQKVLEYFSKDELCKKVKEFEQLNKEQGEQLAKLKNESADWKNKYMRLQAEFENAHKRWDKNRQNLRIEYTATVIKSFLPLYDSFRKALSDNNKDTGVLKGFYDQFMNILKSYKAEPIEAKPNEPFDYNYHEALSSVERDDVPNNTIIDVIQDGWKLDKEIIRYTKVILSKEPKPPEPETAKIENKEQIENIDSENVEQKLEEQKEVEKPKTPETKPENEYVG